MVGSAVATIVWSSAASKMASISALYMTRQPARLRGLLVYCLDGHDVRPRSAEGNFNA